MILKDIEKILINDGTSHLMILMNNLLKILKQE